MRFFSRWTANRFSPRSPVMGRRTNERRRSRRRISIRPSRPPASDGQLGARVFADLTQRGGERGTQASRGRRTEMADEPGARLAGFFDGELDARVFALLAVVEHGDDPGDLHALGIVGRMVVDA